MKFSEEENYQGLTAAIIEYCNAVLVPIVVGDTYTVNCVQSNSLKFNAFVETSDGVAFTIFINDGVLAEFMYVLNSLANPVIDEDIEELAEAILLDKTLKNDIYKSIAYCAAFFVLLHELAHILRQHLHFIRKDKLTPTALCFQEVDESGEQDINAEFAHFFRQNFHKLIELDADAYSTILLLTLSTELFDTASEFYGIVYPNWRDEPENEQHRLYANRIMLYSACLVLATIEAKRGMSKKYPSPFTRVLNIFDTFNQEIYKAQGILRAEDAQGNILYLKPDEHLKDVMSTIVFPAFLNSIDIITESCLLMEHNLSIKYNVSDENLQKNLLSDFMQLLKILSPDDLKTQEAQEFRLLRLYRPKFNELFTSFLSG